MTQKHSISRRQHFQLKLIGLLYCLAGLMVGFAGVLAPPDPWLSAKGFVMILVGVIILMVTVHVKPDR